MTAQPVEIEEYRPWSHRAAWLVACATFPLIWVGGLVTTYDAGMAVPDWPSTYGYNLFLYPWQSWLAGPWDLFIEHGHRLLGSLVGMLAILFVMTTWFDSRRWLRTLSIVALVLVILQGLLGGQRVLLNDRRIAQLHGCLGPLFFAFAAMLTTFTSKWWRRPSSGAGQIAPTVRGLAVAAWIAFGLSIGQLLLGSQLRHGIEYSSAAVFRGAVIFHVALAFGLAMQVVWLGWKAMRTRTGGRIGAVLMGLVICQLLLGLGTWTVKYGWPSLLENVLPSTAFTVQAESMWQSLTVTAHVAMGSLIIALSGVLALRMSRLLSAADSAETTTDNVETKRHREVTSRIPAGASL